MTAVLRNDATTTSQLVVTWSTLSLADSGYSTVISYNLQYDVGTNGASWVDLTGSTTDYVLLQYIVSSNVVAGRTYLFRIRAKNI